MQKSEIFSENEMNESQKHENHCTNQMKYAAGCSVQLKAKKKK